MDILVVALVTTYHDTMHASVFPFLDILGFMFRELAYQQAVL